MKQLLTYVTMLSIFLISPLTISCGSKIRIDPWKEVQQNQQNHEQNGLDSANQDQQLNVINKNAIVNLNEITDKMIIFYDRSDPIYLESIFPISIPMVKMPYEDTRQLIAFNTIRLLREKLTGVTVTWKRNKGSEGNEQQSHTKLSDQQIKQLFIFNQFLLGENLIEIKCKWGKGNDKTIKNYKQFDLTIKLKPWNSLKEVELINKLDYFKTQEEDQFVNEYRFDRFISKIDESFIKETFKMISNIEFKEIKAMYNSIIGESVAIKLDIFSVLRL